MNEYEIFATANRPNETGNGHVDVAIIIKGRIENTINGRRDIQMNPSLVTMPQQQ
jgi:hypothetical protein